MMMMTAVARRFDADLGLCSRCLTHEIVTNKVWKLA